MPAYSVTVKRHIGGELVGESFQCTPDGATRLDAHRLADAMQDEMRSREPGASFEFSQEVLVIS